MSLFVIILLTVFVIYAANRAEQERKKAILRKLSENSADDLLESLAKWNTSNVTSMGAMFSQCKNSESFSSDGCKIPPEQDLTCRRYGHKHETGYDKLPRYIVHEEPTKGYVILNGKKVRLKDCWKY